MSCGCAQVDASTTHGGYKRPEYSIWRGMVQRCHNKRSPKYKYYGARGIQVCEEWRNDFTAFWAHIGPRPSLKHSVERVKNARGYEPGNVRWATQKEQCRNRRSNVRYRHDGAELTLPEWAERLGLALATLQKRIKAGWPLHDVLNPAKRFR